MLMYHYYIQRGHHLHDLYKLDFAEKEFYLASMIVEIERTKQK